MKENREYKSYIILVGLVLVTCFFVFSAFVRLKSVYVYTGWGYDTYHSYVPEISSVVQMILQGDFDFFSFQDGLGGDVTGAQRWLTDPFMLIIILIAVVFQNQDLISALMVLFPILISVCGAIAIYIYLKRYIVSDKARIIAAYMYSMSGYLITTGMHYWFASSLVLFPLLLLSVDWLLYDKKEKWFMLMVFLVAIKGPYIAFSMFISMGVYLLYKISSLVKKGKRLRNFGKALFLGIVGLGISAIFLLPNIYDIIGVSGRVEKTSTKAMILDSFKPISASELKTAILRLLSNNLEGGLNDWHGEQQWFSAFPYFFSILFVFLLIQYLRYIFVGCDKKRIILRGVALGIFVFTIFTNFVPSLFNMFSYNQWRMIFVVLPFFAFVSADVLDNMLVQKRFSVKLNIICMIFITIFLLFVYNKGYVLDKNLVAICILFAVAFCLILTLSYYFIVKDKVKMQKIMLSVLSLSLMANYVYDHRYSLYMNTTPVRYNQKQNYYNDVGMQRALQYYESDVFYRIDRTYVGATADARWSYITPCRSTSTYNSTLNKNTKEYITNMVNYSNSICDSINIIYAIHTYGTYFDTSRASTLGLEYIVSNCKRDLKDWELVDEYENFYIYENKFLTSGGLLFEDGISEETYEMLGIEEKACVENQLVVLDGVEQEDDAEEVKLEYTTQTVDECDVEIENDICMLSISEYVNDAAGIENILKVKIDSDVYCNATIDYTNTDGYLETIGYVVNQGENDIILSVPSDFDNINISFGGVTQYEVLGVEMIQTPIKYDSSVQFINEKMGNVVSGEIDLDSDKILYMSIPYQAGWKAYVDEQSVEILQANYGFMALELPTGNHKVVFEYNNPTRKVSIIVSVFFVGVLIIYELLRQLLYNKNNNKRKGN